MAQVSLFQIRENQIALFQSYLRDNYSEDGEKVVGEFSLRLYSQNAELHHVISWGWVLDIFDKQPCVLSSPPKSVVLIQRHDATGKLYVLSFGTSFFSIDRYANKDFAFDYASRLPINETKRTATANTSSIRNKTISSFRKQTPLEVESGESFTKLKAVFEIDGAAELIGNTIEVGSSLRFVLKQQTAVGIVALVKHVEEVLNHPVISAIPRFAQIKDKDLINTLEQDLLNDFTENSVNVILSEFDVYGDHEVFNTAEEYKIRIGSASKSSSNLSLDGIRRLASDNEINDAEQILNGRVQFIRDGASYKTERIHDIIDYMDENKKCLLINGIWHRFNDDYISYLHSTLSTVPVYYIPSYDLSRRKMDDFYQLKVNELRQMPEYAEKTDGELELIVRRKYYKEYCFNCMRQSDGFILYDRDLQPVDGSRIERMDLYKDDTMFSVKIGNASSGLSYVITQSSAVVNLWRNHDPRFAFHLQNVALWIVLERQTHLPLQDNRLEWRELNMLLLKTQIDSWVKLVRAAGLRPVVYLNYAEPRNDT